MIDETIDNQAKGVVLIVDDSQANLNLLSEILNAAGYRTKTAINGRLALEAALDAPPDLILLDIDMPELDGFEVCRRLKSNEILNPIPVLFISALADTANKIKAFQFGGVDYITKPFWMEEVLARVATHFRIRRYQVELTEKGTALKKTLDDLKMAQSSLVQAEKMASLGVLTAGIAHEINNPINFIKNSAYALTKDIEDIQQLLDVIDQCDCKEGCEDLMARICDIKSDIHFDDLISELPGLIQNISLGVERTEAVVDGLRTYSRQDDVEKLPALLSDLINTALVLLENRYKRKIEIHKKMDDVPLVPVQSGRLLQVLLNVIGNAIDAVEEGGRDAVPVIDIRNWLKNDKDGGYAVVQVTDNGPGISKDVLDKIFDPFFTTKAVGEGVGLGMSISYGIIRDHDGSIDVSSRAGQGTTVTISLPLKGI